MGNIADSWKKGLEEFRQRYVAATRPEDVSVSLQELVLFWASIKEHHAVGRFVLSGADLDAIDKLYIELRDGHLHRFGQLLIPR